jgi:hypothetical protein
MRFESMWETVAQEYSWPLVMDVDVWSSEDPASVVGTNSIDQRSESNGPLIACYFHSVNG